MKKIINIHTTCWLHIIIHIYENAADPDYSITFNLPL